jgi:hypothetical protein
MFLHSPSRLQCLEGGWLFPGYLTLAKPRSVWQRFQERKLEDVRKTEIEICSASLNKIFVNPTYGVKTILYEYLKGSEGNSTLEKAFFGCPPYCFDWFRLGQAGITLANHSVRVPEEEFNIANEAVRGIAVRSGISILDWTGVDLSFKMLRHHANFGAPYTESLLQLNAIATRLMAIAKQHDDSEIASKEKKTVNVSVNFGSGNTFTGPVAVGETIRQSYAIAEGANNDLRGKLEDLTSLTAKLIELVPSDEDKLSTASALKELVETANNKTASAGQIRIKGAGLIEAAKTVKDLVAPISAAVGAIVELFS